MRYLFKNRTNYLNDSTLFKIVQFKPSKIEHYSVNYVLTGK